MTDLVSNKSDLFKRFSTISFVLFIVCFSVACGSQRVQTVADETEANEILDVLLSNGIKSSKVPVGERDKLVYEIQIQGGDDEFQAAIQLMKDHCLPQPMPPLIESSGIISSLEVEKSRELRRAKINIETLLRKIPGVTCVDVNLVEPEDKSLSLDPYQASATVLVNYKTEKIEVDTDQVARMVAKSVRGLAVENVFVALNRTPLRPLPDIDGNRNLRRVLWVTGLGIVTILLFVGFAWFLRKRSASKQGGYEDNDLLDDDFDEFDELDEGSEASAPEELTDGD